jgi:hypothetical protein
VNRGLGDAAVARMTGMSVESVASRRARIVEDLSRLLGLPAADVRSALTEIAPTPSYELDDSRPKRRRRPWAAPALVVVVAAVVVGASLASSGSGDRRRSATTRGESLVALPGGSGRPAGTVLVARQGSKLRLDLSVSHMPSVSHAHYEVWLYDSVVNSVDVGRLRSGETHLSLRLPDSAARYRWFDISVQPTGRVFHSGESVLRAANPLSPATAVQHP